MQYAEFIAPTFLLVAAIFNIIIGVKIVHVTKSQEQPLPWYKQINIALGIMFLVGGLFSLLTAINVMTHNGVSDAIFFVAMIVLGIPFLVSLILVYKAGRYLRQQQNQPQAK